ncbi:MAG: hypothetical protein WDO24_28895 [Pseudomonadota bacterium]
MRSSEVVDKKVREAVVAARGDATRAVSLLVKAAEQDPRLLYAITAPFLQGILFHAVQETISALKGAVKAKAAKSGKTYQVARPAARSDGRADRGAAPEHPVAAAGPAAPAAQRRRGAGQPGPRPQRPAAAQGRQAPPDRDACARQIVQVQAPPRLTS